MVYVGGEQRREELRKQFAYVLFLFDRPHTLQETNMAATRRYHNSNLFRFRYLLQWDCCTSRATRGENKRLITQNCYAKWLNVNLWEANLNLELVEMGHQQRWGIIAAHQSSAICRVWLHSSSTPPRLCSRTVSPWSASQIPVRFGSNEWNILFKKHKSSFLFYLKVSWEF